MSDTTPKTVPKNKIYYLDSSLAIIRILSSKQSQGRLFFLSQPPLPGYSVFFFALFHLILEGFAVYALLLGWIRLMCANLDRIQSTTACLLIVIGTVVDGTTDTLIFSIYYHKKTPPSSFDFLASMCSLEVFYTLTQSFISKALLIFFYIMVLVNQEIQRSF